MNTNTNYYAILGINEKATSSDIKKAYRRLAKTYHPDSQGGNQGAEDKFKKLSEAYSILSDDLKREKYDMLRQKGFAGVSGFNFQDKPSQKQQTNLGEGLFDNLQDAFNNLFNGINGHAKQNSPGVDFLKDLFEKAAPPPQEPVAGADMESDITIPFELAMRGGETIIKTGSLKKVKIKIPAGIENGKRIRIDGQGGQGKKGGSPGDLYLTIQYNFPPTFRRQGNDIHSSVFINIAEAILGADVYINTVHHKKIKLKIPAGTSSGKILRLPELGIPNEMTPGNHYVRIEIQVPDKISKSLKRELKSWAKKAK